MKKDKEQALNQFLSADEETPTPKSQPSEKEIIMNEREGLIERVDKVLVTRDGKQLLREQY